MRPCFSNDTASRMIVLLTSPVRLESSARVRVPSPFLKAVRTASTRSAVATPLTAGRLRFFTAMMCVLLRGVAAGEEQYRGHPQGPATVSIAVGVEQLAG